ncbi:unnamed protein product [Rotaria sp. Silwood1]|nr:unnamed protein product [Rotaria sp. Silwood1]
MDELDIVYRIRKRINNLERKLKILTYENVHGNSDINKRTVARINKIQAELIKLKGIHNDKISIIYSNLSKIKKNSSIINDINMNMNMKISEIDIGDKLTKIKLTPISFKLDDKKEALKNIIYPNDGSDRYILNILSRYRTIINKSKDFIKQPFKLKNDSIETVIILLDYFIRQYQGEICFTNQYISYSDSKQLTATGIINLSSLHLIAAKTILTATFSIKINLNYDRDLAHSNNTMINFILDLNKSLAHLLNCKYDFIRIFSIEKLDYKRGMIKVNIGLTTPDIYQTEYLAKHFQNLVRRSDIQNDKILRFIQSDSYEYELLPIVSYLQLSSKDFNINLNNDYKQRDFSKQDQYYIPNDDYFRHEINLNNKYIDNNKFLSSFDRKSFNKQYPIVYHGTDSLTLNKIIQQYKLESNSINDQHIQQIKTKHNRSSIYLTTDYNIIDNKYTRPLTISNGDNIQTFKIIFQYYLIPNSSTIYIDINHSGQLWQINDPQSIRHSAILLKTETTPTLL